MSEFLPHVDDFEITKLFGDRESAEMARDASTAGACCLQELDGPVVIELLEKQGKIKLRADIELLVVKKTDAP